MSAPGPKGDMLLFGHPGNAQSVGDVIANAWSKECRSPLKFRDCQPRIYVEEFLNHGGSFMQTFKAGLGLLLKRAAQSRRG